MDTTSVQALIDTRHQLDRHASPEPVEWHLSHVSNRWTRRALASAGFGFPSHALLEAKPAWKPIYTVAAVGSTGDYEKQSSVFNTKDVDSDDIDRISSGSQSGKTGGRIPDRVATVQGVNRPFFHLDLAAAVETAIANVQTKTERHPVSSQ